MLKEGRRVPAGCLRWLALSLVGLCSALSSVATGAPPAGTTRADLDLRWRLRASTSSESVLTSLDHGPRPLTSRTWPVELSACANGGGGGVATYTWRLDGRSLGTTHSCLFETTVEDLEPHRLSVEAVFAGRGTAAAAATLQVRDFLIVSIGDSIASGEGNKFHEGLRVNEWEDDRCHRSYWSGPALAAEILGDPDQANVTFYSFACSGARIEDHDPADASADGGVLHPYEGIEPFDVILVGPDGAVDTSLPSQIDQVIDELCPGGDCRGARPIDALVISIGANDVGFGDIIELCALAKRCDQLINDPAVLRRILHPGDALADLALLDDFEGERRELPRRYDRLASAIDRRLNVRRVYLTEVFNPLRQADGRVCGTQEGWVETLQQPLEEVPLLGWLIETGAASFTDDGLVGTAIEPVEARWAEENVVNFLMRTMRAAADRHGWEYVGNVSSYFAGNGFGHGYCVEDDADRWVVTVSESLSRQEDMNGAFHPNYLGHLVYRNRLIAAITDTLWISSGGVGLQFGTRDQPFRTINGALSVARDGDTLRFRRGTYRSPGVLNRSLILRAEDGTVRIGPSQ